MRDGRLNHSACASEFLFDKVELLLVMLDETKSQNSKFHDMSSSQIKVPVHRKDQIVDGDDNECGDEVKRQTSKQEGPRLVWPVIQC